MKSKNNIIILSVVLALICFASCKQEEITLLEPSHRVVFTSEMDFENQIEIGGVITFGDVSPGVISRTWSFPEGVDIIDSDNDRSSEEASVKALFNEVGEFNIRLQQVFENPAYVGEIQRGKELDTTIVVTVLDSIQLSVQAFYLNKDGSLGDELILADDAENELPASNSVRFTFTAIGEPELFQWRIEGGDPDYLEGFQEEIDVKYKRLGTYDLNFIAWRRRPFGRDSVSLSNFIKVVPSTDPVTLDQTTEKDGYIALVFSREMEPSSLSEFDFSVNIYNEGNLMSPAIKQVFNDPDEGNIVLLELENESLYNDDSILVSYAPGTLKTTDGISADGFTDELLVFEKLNILKESSTFDYSFESSGKENWEYLEWGSPWDLYSWTLTNEQAFDGDKSALMEMDPNGGMIIGHKDLNGEDITFPVKSGQDYELGLWVYVEKLGATPSTGLQPDLRVYWNPDTDWAIGGNPTFENSFPVQEWVYTSAYVKFQQTAPTSFMLRGFNGANPESIKVYIDNMSLSEVSLRP